MNVTFFAAIMRDRVVAQAARGVLEAVRAGLDGQARIRVGADVHRRSHPAALRFGHGGEEHLVLQFRQRASGKAGLEHELDEIDAAAVEIGDRRSRFVRRFDLPRQQLRKARHEAKHRRGMSAASGDRRTGVERPRRVRLRRRHLDSTASRIAVHVVGERDHRRHAGRERGARSRATADRRSARSASCRRRPIRPSARANRTGRESGSGRAHPRPSRLQASATRSSSSDTSATR